MTRRGKTRHTSMVPLFLVVVDPGRTSLQPTATRGPAPLLNPRPPSLNLLLIHLPAPWDMGTTRAPTLLLLLKPILYALARPLSPTRGDIGLRLRLALATIGVYILLPMGRPVPSAFAVRMIWRVTRRANIVRGKARRVIGSVKGVVESLREKTVCRGMLSTKATTRACKNKGLACALLKFAEDRSKKMRGTKSNV